MDEERRAFLKKMGFILGGLALGTTGVGGLLYSLTRPSQNSPNPSNPGHIDPSTLPRAEDEDYPWDTEVYVEMTIDKQSFSMATEYEYKDICGTGKKYEARQIARQGVGGEYVEFVTSEFPCEVKLSFSDIPERIYPHILYKGQEVDAQFLHETLKVGDKIKFRGRITPGGIYPPEGGEWFRSYLGHEIY